MPLDRLRSGVETSRGHAPVAVAVWMNRASEVITSGSRRAVCRTAARIRLGDHYKELASGKLSEKCSRQAGVQRRAMFPGHPYRTDDEVSADCRPTARAWSPGAAPAGPASSAKQ